MIPLPTFDYHAPNSLDEAVNLLESLDKPRLIAGGTDLIPLMREADCTPKHLIDIGRISELNYIQANNDYIEIGATTTHSQIIKSKLIKEKAYALFEACSILGSPQIRTQGTLVGNLCNASPAADTAPPLLVYEACLEILSPTGYREMPIEDLFTGPKINCLEPHDIVTQIHFPVPSKYSGSSFHRLGRRKGFTLSIVNAAAYLETKEDCCGKVRVALGSVASTPIRLREVEGILEGKPLSKALAEASTRCISLVKPIDDVRGSAEYRCEMAAVLMRRSLKDAWRRGIS